MHEPFKVTAQTWGGRIERYDVEPHAVIGGMIVMRIESTEQNIFVTKGQAMEFFGLVEPK